jgi:hypothetical protein
MEVYAIPDGNPYWILVVMAFPRHPNAELPLKYMATGVYLPR